MSEFCIFCEIAAGRVSSYTTYSDDAAIAFLDLAPITPGHTLVIPRRHIVDMTADGADQAIIDIGPALHAVSRRLVAAFKADGISIFQSNGTAAGQEVFHLHVHVVPRYDGDAAPVRWTRDAAAADTVADAYAAITG
ncbi:MAG TPA: HIT domain-containing protein [Acidothermaceae bacterium]